ncbi:hypothetical protein DM01DRAFT_1338193 [Hesseltinella vesiculosa]|uniref:C2H2-type domain-containing protein n=1 Tax=Hesseltinella vesiculosa TaxID=101127 RepID=A0A1X2GB47_9FUNG|nr:hypothetical protein DM01DRAFT_1338193 [Hesseltinella vesiculosa]
MNTPFAQQYAAWPFYDKSEEQPSPVFASLPFTGTTSMTAAVHFHSPAPTAATMSPILNTPFLDSDETLSPNCFSPFQSSPMMPFHVANNDVPVAPYIKQEQSVVDLGMPTPRQAPAKLFATDPMDLLIHKPIDTHKPSPATTSTPHMDNLFMPLTSQESWHSREKASPLDALLLHSDSLFDALDDQPMDEQQYHSHDQAHGNPTDTTVSSSTALAATNSTSSSSSARGVTKRRRVSSTDSQDSQSSRRPKQPTSGKKDVEEKRFSCPICKRLFSRRYNLNTHIRTHNANRIKSFRCHICSSAFDRKHDRDRHLSSVHYGTRSFTCDMCESAFCRRDALARHVLKAHRS